AKKTPQSRPATEIADRPRAIPAKKWAGVYPDPAGCATRRAAARVAGVRPDGGIRPPRAVPTRAPVNPVRPIRKVVARRADRHGGRKRSGEPTSAPRSIDFGRLRDRKVRL